jgi:hypothetical protein
MLRRRSARRRRAASCPAGAFAPPRARATCCGVSQQGRLDRRPEFRACPLRRLDRLAVMDRAEALGVAWNGCFQPSTTGPATYSR